jgi:hypothetical protein
MLEGGQSEARLPARKKYISLNLLDRVWGLFFRYQASFPGCRAAGAWSRPQFWTLKEFSYTSSYVNSWIGLGQWYITFLQNVRSDLMKMNITVWRSVIVQSGENLLTFVLELLR